MIIFSLCRLDRLRLMRPCLSFLPQRARAPSTVATAMLSVAGTRWGKKSGAITASPSEKSRLESIRSKLHQALAPESLEITDDSHLHVGHAGAAAGGGHFSVRIISSQFQGRSTLERHRLVYQAVDDMMPAEIHALSIQARTPEEQTSAAGRT